MRKTHGMYKTGSHRSWETMKVRCKGTGSDPRQYHGKGITYDPLWEKFENFYKDMGERPNGMELDRIDSNKNYYKANCRWVTKSHNNANRVFKNKSGLPRGVAKTNKKSYTVRISINNKTVHLGTFYTIEDAEQVYLSAYKKLYGELPPEYRGIKR
jgi:hypothetical protein